MSKVSVKGLAQAFLTTALVASLTVMALLQYAKVERTYHEPAAPQVDAPKPPIPFSLPPEATEPIKTRTPEFLPNLMKAVNSFYVRTSDGSIRFACTVTNIQKVDKGYLALTAKHCVDGSQEYFISIDAESNTPFYRAEKVLVGIDADFAVVSYNPGSEQPVIPIGTNKLTSVGDAVLYIGEPMNLDKILFHGYIAQQRVAKSIQGNGWTYNIGLQIPAAGGSSGSAIIDPKQEAIIAVLTTIVIPRNGGSILTTAVPVSEIRQALRDYNNGRHRPSSYNADHENLLERLFGPAPRPR